MTDLPKRLRITASMIALGERIAWGSDTALMEEAADAIEALSASVENHQLHMLGMARDRDQLRALLAAAPTVKAEQVPCSTCNDTALIGDLPIECPDCCHDAAPSLPAAGSAVEEVEVRGLQWLDTGHYRKKPPQFGYNPHDWNQLMTVAQHQRIVAALSALAASTGQEVE